MTELETMQRAKMDIDKLAQGIDPISGEEMPWDSVLNNVRLARCFFYVSDVLGRVIANGGAIGGRPKKKEFTITQEQLAALFPTQRSLRISEFVEMLNQAVNDPDMKKLSTTSITNWLLAKGFLYKDESVAGKTSRRPTEEGIRLGRSTELRNGPNGDYTAVYYNAGAQQFLLDNLEAILQER